MKFHFKPLDNLQLYFILIFYICPIIPLDIGCVVVCLGKFNIQYFVTCVIITVIPFLSIILVRAFYPYKYIVDDKYLIKVKGKKVILKIEKTNLKTILVKKVSFINYFKFIISLLTYKLSTEHITSFSFLFDEYEVLTNYNYGDFQRKPLNCKFNSLEYVEIMSYKKIKKIAKVLDVRLTLINK